MGIGMLYIDWMRLTATAEEVAYVIVGVVLTHESKYR